MRLATWWFIEASIGGAAIVRLPRGVASADAMNLPIWDMNAAGGR
jgi:hypothetical protein